VRQHLLEEPSLLVHVLAHAEPALEEPPTGEAGDKGEQPWESPATGHCGLA
jgi:hypothetical protein